jgi:hypothetical protein
VKDHFASAFRWILKLSEERRLNKTGELDEHHLFDLTQSIIWFATKRARLVPSLSNLNFELQNFGYIVSKGTNPAQGVHIDLGKLSQYQLEMLCFNEAHLTSEYTDVMPLVIDEEVPLLSQIWNDLPTGLANKLYAEDGIPELVESFGGWLCSKLKSKRAELKQQTAVGLTFVSARKSSSLWTTGNWEKQLPCRFIFYSHAKG